MSNSRPTYAQLLETNNLMQNCGDATYWLCLTRTVQGSKLFPVSPYILLSYLNAFYRYPTLLKKIEARMPAEDIADRARNMGMKITNSALGWALPNFYLLGRELLLSLGFLRPQDALEDVVCVMDFWKRYLLSWHRNDGHITNREYGNRAQILPDRRLEVFHNDLYECQPGDPLHESAHTFLATISQYGFLVSCESRISLTNSGPYRIDDRHQLVVRDFMDLAECSLPWLDGVARDVPYNYLTVPTLVRDCKFRLVDDWGSFEATPEFTAEHLAGIGLYTSDALSEGFVPVGMGSAEELTDKFNSLNAVFKEATNKLWLRIAGWTRDQMIDAGALTYYNIIKDLAHVAGVFEVEDWLEIDPRAERFRPLLNDEFSNQMLGSLVVGTRSAEPPPVAVPDDAVLGWSVQGLHAAAVFGACRRSIRARSRPDPERRVASRSEGRPLPHHGWRADARGLQPSRPRIQASALRRQDTASSARPGSNTTIARRWPTTCTGSNSVIPAP